VFVRIVLLIVLAVASVTGRGGPTDVVSADSIAQVADGDPMDALRVEVARVPVPTFHVIPLVLHGTEVEHPSPEPARVFRPPRASFV
jgi:hypothetical protein